MSLSGTGFSISGMTATSNGGTSYNNYVYNSTTVNFAAGDILHIYKNDVQLDTNTTPLVSSYTGQFQLTAWCSDVGGTFGDNTVDVDNASEWSCEFTASLGFDTSPSNQDYSTMDIAGLGVTGDGTGRFQVETGSVENIGAMNLQNGDILKIASAPAPSSGSRLPPPPIVL